MWALAASLCRRRFRSNVDAAKAKATVRAYRSDWAEFSAWADHRGLVALPATPETLSLYLVELADGRQPAGNGLALATSARSGTLFKENAAAQVGLLVGLLGGFSARRLRDVFTGAKVFVRAILPPVEPSQSIILLVVV